MIKIELLLNNFRLSLANIKDYTIYAFSSLSAKVYLAILLFINAIAWLGTGYIDSIIQKNIIALHYNVDFGINLIGEAKNIYIIPLVGLIIILINTILYISLSRNRDNKIIFHIMFIASAFVNIVLLSAVTSIYLINFL